MRRTAILTAAALLVAEGLSKVEVCFDLEAGNPDFWGDDEINEDTSCRLAAWFTGGRKRWMNGMYNNEYGCKEIHDYHSSRDLYLETHCGDGMWLDRISLGNGWEAFKTWGANNNQGWCLSTEASDWDKFGGGKVPAKTCFYKLKFTPAGKVYGWRARRSTCSWLDGTTDMDNKLECNDGTTCTGWSCCNDHEGRAKCPPNFPFMCAKPNACAGFRDYCCERSCANMGGDRKCGNRRRSEGDENEDGVWELLETEALTEAETSPSLDDDNESDGVWELIEEESSPSLDDDKVEDPSLTRRLERALGLKLAKLEAPHTPDAE